RESPLPRPRRMAGHVRTEDPASLCLLRLLGGFPLPARHFGAVRLGFPPDLLVLGSGVVEPRQHFLVVPALVVEPSAHVQPGTPAFFGGRNVTRAEHLRSAGEPDGLSFVLHDPVPSLPCRLLVVFRPDDQPELLQEELVTIEL